jgi:hypothetical protein
VRARVLERSDAAVLEGHARGQALSRGGCVSRAGALWSIVLIPRITLGCAQNVTEMQLEPDLDLERRIERAKKNNKRRDAVNANVVDL